MEDFILDFNNIKLSALSKSKKINPYVKNTTIGPNSSIYKENENRIITNRNPSLNKKSKEIEYNTTSSSIVIKKLHIDIEKLRQRKLKEAVDSHINRIAEFSKQIHNDLNKHLEIKQKSLLNEKHQQELLILQKLEQHDKDISTQHQQFLRYYEELAERKRRIDKELKEHERRKQLLTELIDKIKSDQVEFRCVYEEICSTLEKCKYPVELKAILGDIPQKLKSLPNDMGEIVSKCKSGKLRDDDRIKASQLVKDIKDVLDTLKQKIVKVTEEQETKKQNAAKPVVVIKRPAPTLTTVQPAQLETCISTTPSHCFTYLQNFLENYTNSYKDLTNNDSFKQFKFDCKKAINIPVNAISAVNSQHLLDKYNRLSGLLMGKRIEVGGTLVCASQHPQGIAFSTNLLARKFVLQCDLMISSKPEAAFCYAAIIIALWNDNQDFGKLVLAHIYRQCPYLVPFYPSQVSGQTDKEYYLSLGYQYNDDIIEKQDKFLKRMTGLMRLYSAIIISKPKRGQHRNPHGISEGWKWLSAFLNLTPIPDITATMLHTFLEIAGSTLQAVYGKVFQKLMNFVCHIYLSLIQKIDSGGPVTRLEVLLQEYKKTGRFEEPRGMLPNNFW